MCYFGFIYDDTFAQVVIWQWRCCRIYQTAAIDALMQYIIRLMQYILRDQSRYSPSQWETSLQCNDVSHWLGAYLDWSLYTSLSTKVFIYLFLIFQVKLSLNLSMSLCLWFYLKSKKFIVKHPTMLTVRYGLWCFINPVNIKRKSHFILWILHHVIFWLTPKLVLLTY